MLCITGTAAVNKHPTERSELKAYSLENTKQKFYQSRNPKQSKYYNIIRDTTLIPRHPNIISTLPKLHTRATGNSFNWTGNCHNKLYNRDQIFHDRPHQFLKIANHGHYYQETNCSCMSFIHETFVTTVLGKVSRRNKDVAKLLPKSVRQF